MVNTALKRQGLQGNEDLRQSAILYMCECLKRFDPALNIQWTTFAYKNIFFYIKRKNSKEKQKQARIISEDIFDLKFDIVRAEINKDAKYIVEDIKSVLTPIERQIIDLKLQGYSAFEIGEKLRYSTSRINCFIRQIKEKAKELKKERGNYE